MTDQLWWDRWPSVLEREQAALHAANIKWTRNEDSFARGILRLDLVLPPELGGHELYVVYPDWYPYFRFQVYAPGLSLPYHSNPFERNLCLMGRRTHWWRTTDTAAGIIVSQLPILLQTAAAQDVNDVRGLEEEQAEPFSDFYSYVQSMILVDSDWVIGAEHRSGSFLIGTLQNADQLAEQAIRGAIIELRSETGEVLHSAEAGVRRAFPGKQLEGRWARVNEPIRQSNVFKFMDELVRLRPELRQAKANHVRDRWLRVWGVLFPEQTAHRVLGEGWVFAGVIDKKNPNIPQPHFQQQPKKAKRR